MDKSKDFLLDLLFPKFCLGCKKEGTYLCDDCRGLLDISEFGYCLCEANGQPKRLLEGHVGKCSICSRKELAGLYFALSYKEKTLTRNLIYQFKYKPYLKDLAKTLASIIVEHLVISGKNTNDIWENSVLVPVPLDSKKIKDRGYNQSEELAKELSVVLNVPVVLNVLVKIKQTDSQKGLSKTEREKNLQGAFAIKSCSTSDVEQLSGKKVFLVDDVYTTGSTMTECAKTLKTGGAKQVWGICLAREG
ncbi:MAG: ComF family protein [Candidatus Staskawiczbacteria bacterium]|nr:ComF family protein [Candidatus Staskawiczbacteria bacterium]